MDESFFDKRVETGGESLTVLTIEDQSFDRAQSCNPSKCFRLKQHLCSASLAFSALQHLKQPVMLSIQHEDVLLIKTTKHICRSLWKWLSQILMLIDNNAIMSTLCDDSVYIVLIKLHKSTDHLQSVGYSSILLFQTVQLDCLIVLC